jgi:capsule biosynthesis phosphatase
MRICVDLDGTICEIRHDPQTYADVAMKPGADVMLKKLHDAGHTIVIHTARNMATTGHNVGKALKNVGKMTLDWLDKHNIVYDEIFFGKPNADITIDDRVIKFEDNWSEMTEERLLKEAKAK